jgi:hypothetical protein
MPPLSFSASLPAPPPDSGSQVALAIPEYHVNRDWVFTGHVEDASSHPNKKTGDSSSSATARSHQKKETGVLGKNEAIFWQ